MLLSSLLAVALADEPVWPDLSEPPRVGGGSKDAAIIVSIEDYVFVDDIPGAQSNGLDWYSYLTDGRGIPASRVALLENQRATREAIGEAIEENRAKVGRGGTLWFVFIGHGAPSRDGSDGLLLGADTQPTAASVYARGLPQSALLAALGEGGQDETVVVLDACFSGQGRDGALVDGLMPLVPDYGDHRSDAIILSAGKGDEFAGPLPGSGRPAFSYLALGALRGWGDADGDGSITAQEVADYSRGALQAMPLARKQTPQIHADSPQAILGTGRERGPSLSKLRRSLSVAVDGATSVDGGSNLAAQLAEMRRLQEQQDALEAERSRLEAQVAEEVDSRRAKMKAEATQLWRETKAITGDLQPRALQMFIDAYQDAHVTVGDQTHPVRVLEVADAERKLADLYRDGSGVTRDYARAVALYTDACERNHAIACNNLAYRHKNGQGVAKSIAQTAAFLARACDLQYEPACRDAADYYREGEGLPQDLSRAISLYRSGCDQGHATSCNELGWYAYKKGVGAAEDLPRALELFEQACDLGSNGGCQNAGDAYHNGEGTAVNFSRAVQLYELGCDKEDALCCNQLGANGYYNGEGVGKDLPRALALFEQACDLDAGIGCRNAAAMYRKGTHGTEDQHSATGLYRRGCELDDANSCNWLGYQHSKGLGATQDKDKALTFYEKACRLGDEQACENAKNVR